MCETVDEEKDTKTQLTGNCGKNMLSSAVLEYGRHAFRRRDLRSSLAVSVYKSSGSGRD